MSDGKFRLDAVPVHLGRGARVQPQPPFTGDPAWYEQYGERTTGDGVEGRLVMMHTFAEPWNTWEVHPLGEELVVCTGGSITLLQEIDGAVHAVDLGPGDAIVNPPGVWHTADVAETATALFITAGMNTENRPR